MFGDSATTLGDLDGDGVVDLAVGAIGDDTGFRGAIHILLLNANGTVKSTTKIASGLNGGPTLANDDYFGSSVASVGDLNGDGVGDLAIGAKLDDTGGMNRGAVHLLFLNAPPNPTVNIVDESLNDADSSSLVTIVFSKDVTGFTSDDVTISGGILSHFSGSGSSYTATFAANDDFNGIGTVSVVAGSYTDLAGNVGGTGSDTVTIDTRNPTMDYGDAPDTAAGTGPGNYRTTLLDGGPRHVIVTGLLLGVSADADNRLSQNAAANADDRFSTGGSDDEDGLPSPLDLLGTIGTQPEITLLATNTVASAATLFGWIDYNQDGVFDNATERTQIAVPSGTTNGRFMLVFPTIPAGSAGTTYARFRLSTDTAAANSIGAATDGEVEDYVFSITAPSDSTVGSFLTIAHAFNGGPTLNDENLFGISVTSVGDLDGDGVADLVVGAIGDDTGGINRGAVHVLFMNTNGIVKTSTKIASELNGGPILADEVRFGFSIASLGDLNGDGVADLVVGVFNDSTGGAGRGAIHMLFMNANGTVKSTTKIAHQLNGGPTLADEDHFGHSVASVGDLDGDGVADLAVGNYELVTGGSNRGAVYALLMNADGTVKSSTKIAHQLNGGPTLADYDRFGVSVAGVGDLNGDGVADLAVGAPRDDTGGGDRGAVYVLLMNANGTVKNSTKIASDTGGGPTLADGDFFGSSVASVSDLDGNGVADLAVGADADDTGGINRGALHLLLMNANGTVKSSTKIAHDLNGGPLLMFNDDFGSSVASVGDLNRDGVVDLAVGADADDAHGSNRGAIYLLFLNAPDTTPPTVTVNIVEPSLNNTDFSSLVTFTFSEPVSGFTSNDVRASNGALSDFSGSESTFTATFTANDGFDGIGSVSVIADSYTDLAALSGNAGSDSVVINTQNPTRDFGDVPDVESGTGLGNYRTRMADGGASHVIDKTRATLFFGNAVDGDTGTLQNTTANSDDQFLSGSSDDEDGVLSPLDLLGTVGASPTITLLTTNTTGIAATLFGWIDYNQDGSFDNATERAQITVPNGTTDGRLTLTFPLIPAGLVGTTYARFRLSTDESAENPTGVASNGEVEDYVFTITTPSDGTATNSLKIASGTNGALLIANGVAFGHSLASVGDLDGDGVSDLAVGEPYGPKGAVHVLFMNANGTVRSSTKISHQLNGGPTLADSDFFGFSVASIGDLDGDGVPDLAVGANLDDTGGTDSEANPGAVYVLFLNANGTAKGFTKIGHQLNGGPTLLDFDHFGKSVASVGDLDGDGVSDLAVGANLHFSPRMFLRPNLGGAGLLPGN